jgi:membrane-associated protease RseP (regulator of RpoE activity)
MPEHNPIVGAFNCPKDLFRERPHNTGKGGNMKPRIVPGALLAAILMLGMIHSAVAGFDLPPPQSERSSRQPWLGVSLQNVTSQLAKKENLKTDEGAYVSDVVRKSPADSAGIQEGDVIVEFNGRQVYDADDVVKAVRKAEVGTKAKVVVMRDGERKELYATLKKSPRRTQFFGVTPPAIRNRIMIFGGKGTMGLSLMELNLQLGKYFEAPEGKGVLVEDVEEGSAAEKAGFKAGDVILKVSEKNVESIRDVRRRLSKFDDGEKASIEILRRGARQTLTLELDDGDDSGCGPMFENFAPPEGFRDFDHFEFQLPDIDRKLEKLRIHLDGAMRKLDDSKREIERKVRRALDKAKVTMEGVVEEMFEVS